MSFQQQRVAILSPGVWQLRDVIREITGFEPVRWLPPFQQPEFGCVVGWGLKRTSGKARELSRQHDSSYIALEDGFIRSVRPGADQPPVSLVIDRLGVHYDASSPSELEALVMRSTDNRDHTRLARACQGIDLLRRTKISKYNHAPYRDEKTLGLDPSRRSGRVLVVDQTAGDASISYGNASASSFLQMLNAARRENPDKEVVVKLHPEVVSGRKQGHLEQLHNDENIHVIRDDVNPWALIDVVDKVYVVTSQMGMEALLAGRQVVCFGAPFYAGWGLTEDRVPVQRRVARPVVEQLFAAIYFDYARYISPVTQREISFEEAVEWISKARNERDCSTTSRVSRVKSYARKLRARFASTNSGTTNQTIR